MEDVKGGLFELGKEGFLGEVLLPELRFNLNLESCRVLMLLQRVSG